MTVGMKQNGERTREVCSPFWVRPNFRRVRGVSRILCPNPVKGRATIIHLGRSFPKGSSDQPGTANGTGQPSSPIWSCRGRGLQSRRVSPPLVGSYPAISPLPSRLAGALPRPLPSREGRSKVLERGSRLVPTAGKPTRRCLFCCAFRSEGLTPRAPGSYPAPRPVAVRTFLPPVRRDDPTGQRWPPRTRRGLS